MARALLKGERGLVMRLRLYYGRDQLDCPPPNGLNHYLPLNKTGPNSTGERFRAIMALLFAFTCLKIQNVNSFRLETK